MKPQAPVKFEIGAKVVVGEPLARYSPRGAVISNETMMSAHSGTNVTAVEAIVDDHGRPVNWYKVRGLDFSVPESALRRVP